MIIWGVDPGLTGAVAVTRNLQSQELVDLEDFADRGRLLPVALRAKLLTLPAPELVVLEDATTREGQDAGATLKTGRTFGHLEGLLVGMGFIVRVAAPASWKSLLGLPAKVSRESTLAVVEAAERLFPGAVFRGPKGGLWDDRAEAALLCAWGWKYVLGRALPVPPPYLPVAARLWG